MKLHIKGKVISIHEKMDILDEDDNIVYRVSSKAISLHDKTHIEDAQGNEIAYIHAKAISIHQVHYVEMADGETFEIKMKLGHWIKNQFEIEELGWKMIGEFAAHDYKILDENGEEIANAHRKWFSLHSIYYLDIHDESKAEKIIATYIVLEHILSKQEAAAASSSSSSSNS